MFTTHPDLIEGTYVVPGMSDHNTVICDVNFKTKPPLSTKICLLIQMCRYGRTAGTIKEFIYIDHFKLQTVLQNQLQKTGLSSKPYSSIPLGSTFPKRPLARKCLLHSFNSRIKRLIRQKQRHYNAARHSNSEQNWCKLRNLRKVRYT